MSTYVEQPKKEDQVFEVYLRTPEGATYHKPLREGLAEFLDDETGYRLTINIEGVLIVLRRSWDPDTTGLLDKQLNQSSVEVLATVQGLNLRKSR